MKIINNSKSMLLLGALAFAMFIYSCKKEVNPACGGSNAAMQIHQDDVLKKAQDIARKIEKIKIVDLNNKVIGAYNLRDGGFTFANAGEGFHFSSSNGVQFVPDGSGGGSLVISTGALGNNSSGGTVVAGNSTLEINFTVCISASDSAAGGFSFGPSVSGVSTVLGISGDFAKILSGDTTGGIASLFYGFAMYEVFADPASGTYKILDWLQDLGGTTDELNNKGFAWVIDFRNMHMFFSKSGELNVSGGSIGFSGKYFEFVPNADATNPFDLGNDPTVNEVDGFGTMGCN